MKNKPIKSTVPPPSGNPGVGGLEQNLKWGWWAAAAAIAKLPRGAPNWERQGQMLKQYLAQGAPGLERIAPSQRYESSRTTPAGAYDATQEAAVKQWQKEGGNNRRRLMEIEADMASAYGYGKCSAHMAIAFCFLFDQGVRPLDEMVTWQFKNHTFVVIGRQKESNEKVPATWGQAAVICDPWLETVCSVADYSKLPYGGDTSTLRSTHREE